MATAAEVQDLVEDIQRAAAADLEALVAQTQSPAELRAALFLAVPVVADTYSAAAGALGLDWYEDLRALAYPGEVFTGLLALPDRAEHLRKATAWATDPLWRLLNPTTAPPFVPSTENQGAARVAERLDLTGSDDLEAAAVAESLARIEAEVERELANAMRETVVETTKADTLAVGWRRVPRNGGDCDFCRFLADKGAVYSRATARFAAHPFCDCTAAPVFANGDVGPEASVLQYVASKRKRSPAEKARLKAHLTAKYG